MSYESQFTVVVPVSLPSASAGLIHAASALARPGRDLRVCALHIEPPLSRSAPRRAIQERNDLRDEVLGAAERAGATLGLRIERNSMPHDNVAEAIEDVARAEAADLIVLGWTKSVLGRGIPSPTVTRLLEHSAANLAIFFERRRPPWRDVLLPFIGGAHDQFALDLVRRIVETGATATILHVVDPARASDESPRLRTADSGPFDDERVTLKVVPSWDPLGEIVRESRRGYDLIAMGVSPAFGPGQSHFGRQHERIARESGASLLIVRRRDVAATHPDSAATDQALQVGAT